MFSRKKDNNKRNNLSGLLRVNPKLLIIYNSYTLLINSKHISIFDILMHIIIKIIIY